MNKTGTSIFLAALAFFFSVQLTFAQGKVFTIQDLSKYNGKNGAKSYTAYGGVVYDVTDSKLWALGEHFGLQAGIDLTEKMKDAPHGPEVFSGFTVVGTLERSAKEVVPKIEPEAKPLESDLTGQGIEDAAFQDQKEPWYSKRIQPLGISMLGWTGILLGIFFVLTFATCFALPWAKLPLPWRGSKIGADPLDESGTHMVWSSVHKHFVWITVILGIIHGILGFLQMVGIYL